MKPTECNADERSHRVCISQTAFVDSAMSRGDGRARLYDPARPYRTITGAIRAIRALSPLATAVAAEPLIPSLTVAMWTVRVAPGSYAENIVLPPAIGLVGSGYAASVIIGTIVAQGKSHIEALSVRSPFLPAITFVLMDAHDRGTMASVSVETLGNAVTQGTQGVIDIDRASDRASGRVVIKDTTILANLSQTKASPSAIVRAQGTQVVLDRVDIFATVSLSSSSPFAAVLADGGARIDVRSGSIDIVDNSSATRKEIAFLVATNGASLYQIGDTVASVTQRSNSQDGPAKAQDNRLAPLPSPNMVVNRLGSGDTVLHIDDNNRLPAISNDADSADATGRIWFVRAGPGSVLHSAGAILDLRGVSADSCVLADAQTPGSSIHITRISARFGDLPPTSGNVIIDRLGNLDRDGTGDGVDGSPFRSGLSCAAIRTVNSEQAGTHCYLGKNDSTVFLGGARAPMLLLDDPAHAGDGAHGRGRTIVVKNVSTGSATEIQSASLFDVPDGRLSLSRGEAVTLQSDGTLWYLVGQSTGIVSSADPARFINL